MLDAEAKLREQMWKFDDNLSAEGIILHYNSFIYLLNIPGAGMGFIYFITPTLTSQGERT